MGAYFEGVRFGRDYFWVFFEGTYFGGLILKGLFWKELFLGVSFEKLSFMVGCILCPYIHSNLQPSSRIAYPPAPFSLESKFPLLLGFSCLINDLMGCDY